MLATSIQSVWKKFVDIVRDYHRVKTDYFDLPIDSSSAIIKRWSEKA